MSYLLGSSLMAVSRAENLSKDLSVSMFGTLEYSQGSSMTNWPHHLQRFFFPDRSERDLHRVIAQTASSTYKLLDEAAVAGDRAIQGNRWRWAGRILAMQHDAGETVIKKLTAFLPHDQQRSWGSKEIARRLSLLAQQFIVSVVSEMHMSSSIQEVLPALKALGRICNSSKGVCLATDSDVATWFVRQLKNHAEIDAFDVWVAIWPMLESSTDTQTSPRATDLLKSIYRFTVWCERDEDRKWLLTAHYVADIASSWLGDLRKTREKNGKKIVVDSEGPLALVKAVDLQEGFARAPQVTSYGAFLNYIEIQGPSISYKKWYELWKIRGCDLNSSSFNALLGRLKEGLILNKMPDWTAFDTGWGFDGKMPVTLSGVNWTDLDVLTFEGKMWDIASHLPHVYQYILDKLEFTKHKLYTKQQKTMIQLIKAEEVNASMGPSLVWYDHILNVRSKFFDLLKNNGGWTSENDCQIAISMLESILTSPYGNKGSIRCFWPSATEWYEAVCRQAWIEYLAQQSYSTRQSPSRFSEATTEREVERILATSTDFVNINMLERYTHPPQEVES